MLHHLIYYYPVIDNMPIIQSSIYSMAQIHHDHSNACHAHVGQQSLQGVVSDEFFPTKLCTHLPNMSLKLQRVDCLKHKAQQL